MTAGKPFETDCSRRMGLGPCGIVHAKKTTTKSIVSHEATELTEVFERRSNVEQRGTTDSSICLGDVLLTPLDWPAKLSQRRSP
jgi:hypothetical protein